MVYPSCPSSPSPVWHPAEACTSTHTHTHTCLTGVTDDARQSSRQLRGGCHSVWCYLDLIHPGLPLEHRLQPHKIRNACWELCSIRSSGHANGLTPQTNQTLKWWSSNRTSTNAPKCTKQARPIQQMRTFKFEAKVELLLKYFIRICLSGFFFFTSPHDISPGTFLLKPYWGEVGLQVTELTSTII